MMKKTFLAWLDLWVKIPGSLWVDLFSIVALYRFTVGKPVDLGTYSLVLGIYAGSKTVQSFKGEKANA